MSFPCVVTPRGGAPPASTDGRTGRQPGRVSQTPAPPTGRPACPLSMLVVQHRETNIVVLQHLFLNVCCSQLLFANVFPQTSHLYGLFPSVHSTAVGCQMAGVRERLHYYTRYRQTAPPVILISWCDVTDGTGPATATGSVGGALGAVSVDGHRRRLRRRVGRSRPRKTQQPSGQTTAERI